MGRMMRPRKPPAPAGVDRLELVEEAAECLAYINMHARLRKWSLDTPVTEWADRPAPGTFEAEHSLDPREAWRNDRRLLDVIEETLSAEELELARAVAEDVRKAPWPPRKYPDETPSTLRDLAFGGPPEAEVVSLEEKRRSRHSNHGNGAETAP